MYNHKFFVTPQRGEVGIRVVAKNEKEALEKADLKTGEAFKEPYITVKELIDTLNQMDPTGEMEVQIYDGHCQSGIDEITTESDENKDNGEDENTIPVIVLWMP